MSYKPPERKRPKIAFKSLWVILGLSLLFFSFFSLTGLVGLLSIFVAFLFGVIVGMLHQYIEDKKIAEPDLSWAISADKTITSTTDMEVGDFADTTVSWNF